MTNTINWQLLTDTNHPVEKGDYFVACDYGNGAAEVYVRTWYNEGDTILLSKNLSKPANWNSMSAEEKLLHNIFEGTTTYTVEKAGFYEVTADYGLDEEKFPGCSEIPLICEGKRTWFAQLPASPEGLMNQNEYAKAEAKKKELQADEKRAKQLAVIDEAAKEGGLIDQRAKFDWRHVLEKEDVTDVNGRLHKDAFQVMGGIFDVDEREIAATMMAAFQMVDVLDEYMAGNVHHAFRSSIFKTACDGEERHLAEGIRSIMMLIDDLDTMNVNKTMIASKYKPVITFILTHELCPTFLSVADMQRLASTYIWTRKYTVPEQIIFVTALTKTMSRLSRCARLLRLQAPEIIMQNEYRMLFESLFVVFHRPAGFTDKFAKCTGYTIEGKPAQLPDLNDYES